MKHLLVDISAHGYGHLAQTAPVVNALAERHPGLRITVRSAAPLELLRQRLRCEFHHVSMALDFGMQMRDAATVDVPASLAAYRAYHENWPQKVVAAACEMAALEPDLVLANVPYLSLAAAHAAGIPAVALCCLNWADIYQHYAAGTEEAERILGEMRAAYASAACFLRVEPAMPMTGLANLRSIAPIAECGVARRAELVERLALQADERLVLLAMGGIDYRLPLQDWVRLVGVRWIIPDDSGVQRENMVALSALPWPFYDVLASCDAVLSKPGYGTFVEAACAGVPVLYVTRGDWPEQPYLVAWLARHGVAHEVAADTLRRGDLSAGLAALWAAPRPARPLATGAAQAAEELAHWL